MKKTPDVSIILTSYNHEKFIGKAIQSVLDQTFQNFELIIIDDCSSDNSWDIIKSFKDSRIIAHRYEERCRGAKWINEAIETRVRGKYISIHHSDDLFHPEKTAKQFAFLEAHSEVGAVFSHVNVIDEDGLPFTDTEHFYFSIFRQQNRSRYEWLNRFFYYGNCLCHPSILIRKECYENVGLYNPFYGSLPDFDIWVRLCLKYEIHVLEEPLISFRVFRDNDNTSASTPETAVRVYNEYRHIVRNYLKISSVLELKNIFPGEVKIQTDECELIPYELARLSLETELNRAVLNDFGINLVYEIINGKDTHYVKYVMGYDYLQLIEKSAQIDVRNYREIEYLKADLARSKKIISDISKSFKWQLTSFLSKAFGSFCRPF